MRTKTEIAVQYLQEGKFSKALSIIKRFKIGFTPEQKRIIEISADISNGNGKIYSSIGVDPVSVISDCKKILQDKYGIC